jgi:chromosome segregation ATPase
MSDTRALKGLLDIRRHHARVFPGAWWELAYIDKAAAELAELEKTLQNWIDSSSHAVEVNNELEAKIKTVEENADQINKRAQLVIDDMTQLRAELERQRTINKTIAHDVRKGVEDGYKTMVDELHKDFEKTAKYALHLETIPEFYAFLARVKGEKK